ncbi:hypothetical protein GTPT_1908 [Tatumella ptyseos ATCC 33301]|uniref:Uncharacterized protein n=1 Tax=Tatumella ptyseos ATCC 33301 TaxID=1005995 RepID=A0A085JF76_9GAMM|nr:hypothetical protein GTPT_1908 [Tatumella ptyseos ATCC 33301]
MWQAPAPDSVKRWPLPGSNVPYPYWQVCEPEIESGIFMNFQRHGIAIR